MNWDAIIAMCVLMLFFGLMVYLTTKNRIMIIKLEKGQNANIKMLEENG